ncbi:MAG: hypothetical protein AAF497_01140, partial [Planctomycetota bacterium]
MVAQTAGSASGTPYAAALKLGDAEHNSLDVSKDSLMNVSEDSLIGLFNGAATQNINLFVPSGHNGHTPILPLRYSSNLVDVNSEFGFGWEMELGRIYRVRARRAGELYGDDPGFYLQHPIISGLLTPIGTDGDISIYALRRESQFARIIYEQSSDSWTVSLRNGEQLTFGETATAKQFGLANDTFAWHLSEHTDRVRNKIAYDYAKPDRKPYPKHIRYAFVGAADYQFAIDFLPFADAPDAPSNRFDHRFSLQSHVPVKFKHVIDAIRISVRGEPTLQYDFGYESDSLQSRTDLHALTVTGFRDSNTLSHSLQFTYERDGFPKHALKTVKTYLGGMHEYEYMSANPQHLDGQQLNSAIVSPMPVVASLTRNSTTSPSYKTTYLYQDGISYFDDENGLQQSGFGRVAITDALDQTTVTYFHQGGGFDGASVGESADNWYLLGKPYRTEQFDAGGILRQLQIVRFQQESIDPRSVFVYPESTVTTVFDDGANPVATAKTYSYDLDTGNLLSETEHGFVNAQNDGLFVELGADDRRTEWTYATKDSWTTNFQASKSLYDSQDRLIAQDFAYFDNLPYGQVGMGNITAQHQMLLQESRALITAFEHDSYGNVTAAIDPDAYRVETVMDSLGLYPDRVLNAIYATDYDYDLTFGTITHVREATGLETKTHLDPLGRPTLVEQSSLTATDLTPVVEAVYAEDSLPHSRTIRVYSEPSVFANAVTYFDGFHRAIQTRQQTLSGYSVTATEYDALDRVIKNYVPRLHASPDFETDASWQWGVTTNYDVLDRVTEVKTDVGKTTTAYLGTKRRVSDANNNITVLDFDAFDRIGGVEEHNNGELYYTQYAYSPLDQVTNITDHEGNTRQFVYDSLQRLLSAEDLHATDDTSFGIRVFEYDDR